MKKGKGNNHLLLILVVLASAFYYRETILKFISRGKDVKDLSGIIKSEQYVKVVKVRGTVKKVQ
ncbi:MAG: hypothetical protein KC493_17340, partial [Bacteriovoracaceae bacterium]|nr:hypothetical protein [Bacteriovoracaceae bacterium]